MGLIGFGTFSAAAADTAKAAAWAALAAGLAAFAVADAYGAMSRARCTERTRTNGTRHEGAGPLKSYGRRKKNPPLIGPKKELRRKLIMFSYFVLEISGFKNSGFGLFPGVLEGLGSSGRLIGTISTYPGTY